MTLRKEKFKISVRRNLKSVFKGWTGKEKQFQVDGTLYLES